MGLLTQTLSRLDLSSISSMAHRIMEEINGRISFGHPDSNITESSNGRPLNIEGTWVVLTITNAGGSVVCTHNLDVNTTSVVGAGGTVYPANVRWIMFGIEYGDKTAATATPAAPAALVFNLHRMVGSTMTSNSITLNYLVTGIIPSGTEPLTVTLFFTKALN